MNISPINIYSNYNTPSFGVSLKITTNKKVTAKDAAEVLTVPATICLALVTGKSGKTANLQDRSVTIGNNEYFIDRDGHLTQTPPDERHNGYYILSKDNKIPIYKIPSGKLMTQQGTSAEPAMAVDVLKDEIKKVDKENIATEAKIESLHKYIDAVKTYTDKEIPLLEQKLEVLSIYYDKLKGEEFASILEKISDDDFYIVFLDNSVHEHPWNTSGYHENVISFNREKIFKKLFRTPELNKMLEEETKFEQFEHTDTSSNINNSEIYSQLDNNSDVNSLLGILEQKRNALSVKKNKLNIKQKKTTDIGKKCSDLLKDYCKKINDKRKDILNLEENSYKYYSGLGIYYNHMSDLFTKKCSRARSKASDAIWDLVYKMAAERYFTCDDMEDITLYTNEFVRYGVLKDTARKYFREHGGNRSEKEGLEYELYDEAFTNVKASKISNVDMNSVYKSMEHQICDHNDVVATNHMNLCAEKRRIDLKGMMNDCDIFTLSTDRGYRQREWERYEALREELEKLQSRA